MATSYETTLKEKRGYNESRKHPCSICGNPCSHGASICKDCYQKDGEGVERARLWRVSKRHPCKICGELCDPRSLICRRCYLKPEYSVEKYCRKCGTVLHIKTKSGHCTKCQRGSILYNFKGRKMDKKGYVYFRCPEHPRATKDGYIMEHIIVWEQKSGKPLPKGWVVHHLNGIKNDNRPINLQGLPSQKHYEVLQAKAKRIQELEALLNGQHQLL